MFSRRFMLEGETEVSFEHALHMIDGLRLFTRGYCWVCSRDKEHGVMDTRLYE